MPSKIVESIFNVAVSTPAHSGLGQLLSYKSDLPLELGALVKVPLGRREVTGVVWSFGEQPDFDRAKLKSVICAFDIPPLGNLWRDLISFAARYYQRNLGEIALMSLPPLLRDIKSDELDKLEKRIAKLDSKFSVNSINDDALSGAAWQSVLSPHQAAVLDEINNAAFRKPFLLFGATGSGKTEIYMQAAKKALLDNPAGQVLVLVPEINLTPQLLQRFSNRFSPWLGDMSVVAIHSGLTPVQRANSWLLAHLGRAKIILGTRISVLSSLRKVNLVIVDEEHDASYKQQEGARYSARDLAIYLAHISGAKVILGSATPSLESWHWAKTGKYKLLEMPFKIGTFDNSSLPKVIMQDMKAHYQTSKLASGGDLYKKPQIITNALLDAIKTRISRRQQSILLLNKRGYAPVLQCPSCDWKSDCKHCSAYRVFHKSDKTLRCHHCGSTNSVPRFCPTCGNPDILPIGIGTEQLQSELSEHLKNTKRPDGQEVRIIRIDADTSNSRGAKLEENIQKVHDGVADVIVGTQMIAKGHDFKKVTLVAAVSPDGALYSADFRAPERLFALLMQAAGRAGRDANLANAGDCEIWVQSHNLTHPIYKYLSGHDYAGFATQQLQEREQGGLSPFSYMAVIRADAKEQETAQNFLNTFAQFARANFANDTNLKTAMQQVSISAAIPLIMQKVSDAERAQILLESPSRAALHKILTACLNQLYKHAKNHKIIRWTIDVDPISL